MKLIEPLTLKNLDHKTSARPQNPLRQIERNLTQIDGPRLIDGRHSANIGGHIRNNNIDPVVTQLLQQLLQNRLLAKIPLQKLDSRQRFHRQDIHCQYPAALPHDSSRHLGPADGRRADVALNKKRSVCWKDCRDQAASEAGSLTRNA